MITTKEEANAQKVFVAKVSRAMWRAAAGLVILTGGIVTGRLSAGMPIRTALALESVNAVQGTQVAMSADEFSSTAAAMQSLQKAQQDYERAMNYLAVHDTSTTEVTTEGYRTTLAALDEMAETSLKALNEAPADPIINQVYFTTLGARNMTLGKLASALPVGSRLSRF